MSNHSILKSEWIPEKAELTTYLSDVSEIETAIFTVEKTVEEARKGREAHKLVLERTLNNARQDYERDKQSIMDRTGWDWVQKQPRPKPPTPPKSPPVPEEPHNVKGRILGFIFGGYLMFGSLAFVPVSQNDGVPESILLVGLLMFAIGLTIAILGFRRDVRRNQEERNERAFIYQKQYNTRQAAYQQACKKYEDECQAYEAGKEAATKEAIRKKSDYHMTKIRNAEQALEAFHKNEISFLGKIDALTLQKQKLQKHLQQLYAYNLVPPDYRTMDCTLMLTHIFRNDLADNMRDAINLYETRVFRGEVVRGIKNIYNNLEKVAIQMGQIGRTLESVRHNVSLMSQDLCALSDYAERNACGMETLLSETKSERFAAEAMKKSIQTLEHYAAKWDRFTD